MLKKQEKCRDELLEMIRRKANENDGVAVSSDVNSTMRQKVVNEFGSWRNACQEAGVQCPSMSMKKGRTGWTRWADVDLSGGFEIKNVKSSICFDCARSAAPVGLRCSWEDKFVLPKGAIYKKEWISTSKQSKEEVSIVLYCPNFVNYDDVEFNKKIYEERKRLLRKKIDEELIGIDMARVVKG